MRLLRLVRAILWSLFGVRRRAEAARDLEGVSPWVVGAAAGIALGLVIGSITLLVTFLTRDRSAPQTDTRPAISSSASAARRHGPVVVRDTLEERVAPCQACHTDTTQVTHDGFSPRIAGKPAGYLYNQLVSFRDGRRTYPPMVYLLQNLSDDYLREMAEHFSRLRLPHPPPEPPALSPDQASRARALIEKGDPSRGVPACSDCHGKELAGVAPFVPGILGLPRQYMNAQFGAWRSGRLRSVEPDCMAEVARRLAPEDTVFLAAWLAALPAGGAPPESTSRKLPLECGSIVAQAAASVAAAPSGKGAYLVAAGDCIACHTVPGGKPFAGGRAIETPFGTVYSTNITPDPRTGIGSWSREDFRRALHEGRGKDGRLLYPAFPYPNFTQVSAQDADAMFDYLRSLPAVPRENTPHAVRWPYGTQAALWGWRAMFFRAGTFQPDPQRDAQWNRGAYLVRGLGHCDACHAERNLFGAPSHSLDLGGGLIPMQNWFAPPLASAARPEDIVSLLRTGLYARGSAMGPMAEVVHRSTQHLAPEDAQAIASYLQSLPAAAPAAGASRAADEKIMARGAAVYGEHCAQCHGDDGQGAPPAYPPLAGNPSVSGGIAANAIKAVLHGGYAPSTAANPRPYGMPAYVGRLGDDDIADVLTYIRSSWGNRAGAVSPVDIERYRGVNVGTTVR